MITDGVRRRCPIRRAAGLVLLTTTTLLLPGCGDGARSEGGGEREPARTTAVPASAGTTQASKAEPSGSGDTSIVVERVGGLCPLGTCRQQLTISSDGSWQAADGDGGERDGRLSEPIRTDLLAAADTVRRQDLVAGPFTGTCPTAYDGVEMTITVERAGEDLTVASCNVRLREDAAFLQLLLQAQHEIDAAS